ncbi:unnamed protein product [Alopecurus aequalis]
MVRGKLEVLLVSAKGLLDDSDFFHKIDPYVILTCRGKEQKSTVKNGSEPEWNETFIFTVSCGAGSSPELNVKIMDSDTFSADDLVGEASIPLEAVLLQGSLPPDVHRIVKDEEYHGEIKIALTFTPAEENEEEESYGGWNQSS